MIQVTFFINPLVQGFSNFSAHDPQNNGASDSRPPVSSEVVKYTNVTRNGAHAPIGQSKHAHSLMTTQRSNNQIFFL